MRGIWNNSVGETMEVSLFSPRMGVSYTGRLVSVDAARQSFVAQVDDADVLTHPSSLMEATLCVRGVRIS